MTDHHLLDATALAAKIANKDISAREAVDAAAARIEALNPTVNAVIWSDFDAARRAADAIDDGIDSGIDDAENRSAPFAGVPFLIKDIGATQAGLPMWFGNRALKKMDHRRVNDTELGAPASDPLD